MGVEWVMTWVSRFLYPAVFALLVGCGLGMPLSEDLIVLVGGTVVAKTHGLLWLMILSAYCGKVTGDTLIFRIGRKLGPAALAQPRFKKLFTPERVSWIQTHFKRYGLATVFLARFLPGLRAPTYLAAGVSGFSFKLFLAADAVAAAVSAPLLTWLGYRYGMAVFEQLHRGLHGVVLGVVALILGVLGGRWVRDRLRARALARSPEVSPRALEELRQTLQRDT